MEIEDCSSPELSHGDFESGRGYVIIVSQNENRLGNKKDLERLRSTFNRLSCKIIEINDQSRSSIEAELGKIKAHFQDDKTIKYGENFQYIALFVMAHGGDAEQDEKKIDGKVYNGNYILDNEDKPIPTKVFEDFLTNNLKFFLGKFKGLFFQACRGDRDGRKVSRHDSNSDDAMPFKMHSKVFPDASDSLIVYASGPGTKAYRKGTYGTITQ